MSELSKDCMRIVELLQRSEKARIFNPDEVCAELGISQEQYVRAVKYLESEGCVGVVRVRGSAVVPIYRGPHTASWLEREREKYLPLSDDSKELGQRLFKWGPDGERIGYPHKRLDWPWDRYLAAARELRDLGLIEDARVADQESALSSVRITQVGRLAVRSNYKREAPTPAAQSVVVEGDQNIIIVGRDITSALENYQVKIWEATDVEILRQQIDQSLEKIVAVVRRELEASEAELYESQVVTPLKDEVAKPPRAWDLGEMRRLLGIMSSVADLEGAIEFGERAVRIGARIAPHLAILLPAIDRVVELVQ